MPIPLDTPPTRPRARWLAIGLAVVAIASTAAGAFLFSRTQLTLTGDPGRSSRTPETLDKLLARAQDAERAGDFGSAVVAYRFVLAVGAKGDPELEPYMAAARRGLARLGQPPEAHP